jgi:hypothetical protein
MTKIKYMTPQDFQAEGYLQEANRQFFHPLGLALSVASDEKTGCVTLSGIWDYRDDPEGMFFAPGELDTDDARQKATTVETQRLDLLDERFRVMGAAIQPLDGKFRE